MTPTIGCPSCGAALTGAPACPSCGLPLTGEVAGRLWQVDQQRATLAAQQQRLDAEREDLLARLRAGTTELLPSPGVIFAGGPGGAGAPQPQRSPGAVVPRPDAKPVGVQNVLLTLGALLLALAGVVFTAVTYRHLGVVGRAAVLLALTSAAAWAPVPLSRRGLTASAEALGAVALALAALDLVALRKAGVGQDVDGRSYAAVALAVHAGLTALYAWFVPLRVSRVVAPLVAQLPVPLVLARLEVSASTAAGVLSVQALADLVLGLRLPRLPQVSRVVTAACAGPLSVAAVALSAAGAEEHDSTAGVGLLGIAVVLAAASALARPAEVQLVAALPVVTLVGGAAVLTAQDRLTDTQLPLVAVAVVLLALPVAAYVPVLRRTGAVLSALLLAALTVLSQLEPVVQAVAGPVSWLGDPWTRSVTGARGALGPDLAWDGTVVTLVVLAASAAAVVVAGLLVERLDLAAPAAGVLLVLAAMCLPLGLATSYRDALLLLLLVALVLGVAAAAVLPHRSLQGTVLVACAAATAVLDACWSVADQDSTLTVLPLTALVVAGLAVLVPGVLTGVAVSLAAAELGAWGAARDLATDQVGALLVAAGAVAVALSFVLRDRHRLGAEGAAVAVGAVSVGLATHDPGWLSWVLVLQGLLALAVSVRSDRRQVGVLGGLLLVASSWVRLVDADVTAPEPYVAPLAAVALVLGHLRRRAHPGLGSFPAYGGGLSLALVPTLLKSFADDSPTRGLVLLTVAVGVVLVGARARLQAPLAVGGGVAVLDALHLVGPYAAALPRWLLLGVLGVLLVVVGATYEQRLKELQRVRDRFRALT